jgi:transcription factor STE12
MMDTYDPRPHPHHHHHTQLHSASSHPHYQTYATNPSAYSPYQQQQQQQQQQQHHHSVSFPTDSTLPGSHIYSNNGTAVRSAGSAPSSHSGSGHSTPEGTYLDDFSPSASGYSTSANTSNNNASLNVNPDSLIASSSNHHTSSGLPTPPATTAGPSRTSSMTMSGVGVASSSSNMPSAPTAASSSSASSSTSASLGTQLSRQLTHKEQELLAHLDRLKFFLATAPSRWTDSDVRVTEGGDVAMLSGVGMGGMSGMSGMSGMGGMSGAMGARYQTGTPMMPHPNTHPALNRFLLPSGECPVLLSFIVIVVFVSLCARHTHDFCLPVQYPLLRRPYPQASRSPKGSWVAAPCPLFSFLAHLAHLARFARSELASAH